MPRRTFLSALRRDLRRARQAIVPAAIALLFASSALTAEAPDAGQAAALSLADALHLALARNYDLIAAQDDLEQAHAQRRLAREWPNPTLSLSTAKINSDGSPQGGPLRDRSYDTIIGLSELIELGGKRSWRQRSADHGIASATLRRAFARLSVRAAVERAYIQVVALAENRRILDDSVATLTKQADIAQFRFEHGDVGRIDVQQIQNAADQRRVDERTARHDEEQAWIALARLLAVDPASGRTPSDGFGELDAALAVDDRAIDPERRIDVRAAQEQVAKARADLGLARAGRVPDPTLSVQYERQPPDQPNTVGVGVSIPLPVLNQNGGAIDSASSTVRSAEHALARARDDAAADLAAARADLAAAQDKWRAYRDDILPRSQSNWDTIQFAYQKGAASLLDLLSAQRDLNDVRIAAAAAHGDLLQAESALAVFAADDADVGRPTSEGERR